MVETTTPIHYSTRQAPPPEPATGDYLYGSKTVTGDRHFFERLPDGRLQMPSSLCMRERFTHAVSPNQGVGWCQTCVAELRDSLRATVVALGRSGIKVDDEVVRFRDALTAIASDGYGPTDREIAASALGWPVESDDQDGDHFVRPTESAR
jgi:hypothetical protein